MAVQYLALILWPLSRDAALLVRIYGESILGGLLLGVGSGIALSRRRRTSP